MHNGLRALLIASLLFQSGCGLFGSNSRRGRSYNNNSAGSSTGRLVVNNRSRRNIHVVNFSLTSDSNWGPDQLGSRETIPVGSTRSWYVPAGTYNVRIEFADGEVLDSLEEYHVRPGGESACNVNGNNSGGSARAGGGNAYQPRQAPIRVSTGRLVVHNRSRRTIEIVNFSLTSDSDWGPDQLGSSETIYAGSSRTWHVPAGTYHVRIKFDDGEVLDSLEEYAVSAGSEAACNVNGRGGGNADYRQPYAATGSISVVNYSSSRIREVYISPTSDEGWGDDQLGSQTISAGSSFQWNVAAGQYHIKVVLQNGSVLDSLEVYTVQSGQDTACTIR